MGFFSKALGVDLFNKVDPGARLINDYMGSGSTGGASGTAQSSYTPPPVTPSYQIAGNWTPQELLPEHLKGTRVGLNQALPSYTQTPNPLDQGKYVGNPNHGGGGSFMPMPRMVDEGQRMNTYPRFEESPGQPMPYADWQGSMPGRPNYQGGGYNNQSPQFSPENRWGLDSFGGKHPTQEELQNYANNSGNQFGGMFGGSGLFGNTGSN